jgi:DNA-binding CsgD family transcriptional regulator
MTTSFFISNDRLSSVCFADDTEIFRDRLWEIGMILQKSYEFLTVAGGIVALLTALIYTHAPSLEKFYMKHLNVLAMVVNLLIGVWAILYFQQKSRRFHDDGLRLLLGFMLIFNLFEFVQFILIYFFSNLTPAQLKNSEFLLKGMSWPLRTLLLLGWYIFQYKIIAWQREKKLPRWLLPALFLFTGGLTAYFLLAMRFPAYMLESPLLNFWNLYLWPLIILQAVWLAMLLAESRRREDPGRRRAGMALAWLFFGHILLQSAKFLLGAMGRDNWLFFLSKLLILYTNLLPVLWLKFYYIPWAGSLSKLSNIGSRLDSLQQSHGISARELEILRLVLDGKSNKQMEDRLFISIHTVKSHVYNLYRKLGVKNHRQLAHFIATRQQENP